LALDLAKMGQTTCHDASGFVISCAGTGQDGETQNGIDWPDPRFTDNGNGTVTDHLTGLIWLKDLDCFGDRLWSEALTDAVGLADGTCGLTDGSSIGDWRLPNGREILSAVSFETPDPALPVGHPFASVPADSSTNYFWGSMVGVP
jgi:hypothetical protein